ncbi:prephenate dehydratase [Bordetella genomosp. 13]|uniref:Bifunctional chorismate mutase/prephenate dehydratase n=1 Tax=Bordetella genomosp. 13 TaxID=463040 RepID=A0A1W6ZF17_9BORD|nr:prephenate dehydratase [Bordetella genomosp. 13]ARP95740.1 chorismate mutase [Bordetella genomosp. 13]
MDDDTLQSRLRPLRDRIDAIDAQILDLLSERARTAQAVGEVKHEVQADGAVLRPEREAAVIRGLQQKNRGPFPNAGVAAVWTEIMSACRGLERGMTVAYLGPQGSFSEQAALDHFGHSVQRLPCPSFDEVFRAVEAGQADVGMVPVENSTEGAVNRSLDLLLATPLKILGERSLVIRHCLMTRSGGMDGVTTISAHPQALAQCQGWLTRNYPDLERVAAASNSEAARVAAENPAVAAIAGEVAAEPWGLSVVAAGIQDDAQNRTRFVAVGTLQPGPSGRDKTSLILAVPNRAGAVYEMLAPLAASGVSMTRFESRPARTGQWEYYFYIDLQGHRDDPQVAQALATLQSQVAFFKVLGSYPAQQA